MSNMNAGMAFSQFQSVQGPADSRIRHTELEGYQPVSRIGLCCDLTMRITVV